MKIARINLIFGVTLFIIFLITGYYMKEYFKPNHLDNHLMRLQIRSNHIYILFISLLNILSFRTTIQLGNPLSKVLDYSTRIVLILAGVLSLLAFVYEHTGIISNRILTLITVILSLTSIGLFLINELINLAKSKNE
jgi:uncharacterized membrane protein